MNIVVSANSKYMRYLYVMLVSLFESNRDSAITIYVMQKDFSDYDKRNIVDLALSFGQEVVFLYVDRSRFAGLPVTEKFSIEAYFRLIMGELLPVKVDKALYLDVDVIVYGRIRELYETDITGYIAAVCPDMDHPILDPAKMELFGRKVDLRYFNSGVMLWNVKRLRNEYGLKDFMEAARALGFSLQYADQEILNYLLYDKVIYLDEKKYNLMVRGDMGEADLKEAEGCILHFSGCNPWQAGQKNGLYKVWWTHAKRTPFYLNLAEEQFWKESEFSSDKEAVGIKESQIKEIYERAFQLKGSGRIRACIEKDDLRYGLYGAGAMAEVVYELLQKEGMWGKVSYVYDKSRTGEFHGIEIKDKMKVTDGITLIVTPTYKTLEIVKDLRKELGEDINITTLLDWLKNIE